MAGRIIALVGPSGAGKDTLLAGLIAARPGIHRARRVISRPADDASEPFESVTPAEFAALRAAGAFALHWSAHGLGYGIRAAELAPVAQRRTVIFNGARRALAEAQALFPALEVIEITVDPAVLAHRLAARGRESAEEIARRLARADLALPAGIARRSLPNDRTKEEGVARLIAAIDAPLPALTGAKE